MNEQRNSIETDEIEVNLLDLAVELLKKWYWIVVAAVLGLVLAILVTKCVITPTYDSKAMLYVLTNTTSVTSVADLQIGTAITGDFEVIATSKPVIDKAIKIIKENEGVKFTRGDIQGMLKVSSLEDTRILVIETTSENAEHACMVANAVAEATAIRMEEITKKDPPTTVELAEVAKEPSNPSMTKNAILGFLIGAVLACAVFVIQYMLNDNIKTEEDVWRYLGEPTLVSIPLLKDKDNKAEELGKQKGGKGAKKKAIN